MTHSVLVPAESLSQPPSLKKRKVDHMKVTTSDALLTSHGDDLEVLLGGPITSVIFCLIIYLLYYELFGEIRDY